MYFGGLVMYRNHHIRPAGKERGGGEGVSIEEGTRCQYPAGADKEWEKQKRTKCNVMSGRESQDGIALNSLLWICFDLLTNMSLIPHLPIPPPTRFP